MNTITLAGSAHEKYQALDRGYDNTFNYNNECFTVCRPGIGRTEITDSHGNTAYCSFRFSAYIDYQGIAFNLQANRVTQFYDRDGNLCDLAH